MNWNQLKGKVKEQRGRLTDDHIKANEGKRDQLTGKIQESYGLSRKGAKKQIADREKSRNAKYPSAPTWSYVTNRVVDK